MKIKNQKVLVAGFDNTQGGSCILRSIAGEKKGLDTTFGTVFVYDRNINSYDSPYPFHVWNVDEEHNVYDTGSLIQHHAEIQDFKTKPSDEWEIKVVEGWDLDYGGGYTNQSMGLIKMLNKRYKGKYDAIYVEGFAFNNAKTKKIGWDEMDVMLETAEGSLVS